MATIEAIKQKQSSGNFMAHNVAAYQAPSTPMRQTNTFQSSIFNQEAQPAPAVDKHD
jgi:hypothetical protein